MRTKKEIQEEIKKLEEQKKKAFIKYEYALSDELEAEIRALRWVLTESKVK